MGAKEIEICFWGGFAVSKTLLRPQVCEHSECAQRAANLSGKTLVLPLEQSSAPGESRAETQAHHPLAPLEQSLLYHLV